MTTHHFATATFALGLLGASFAACSTATQEPMPGSGAGQVSAGAGGIPGSSAGGAFHAAGSNNVAGSNNIAGSNNVAGSNSTAGSNSGGATGTAGSNGSAGAGGGAAMSCGTLTPVAGDAKCCVASGTAAALAIDDLEDKDNVILPVGSRQGYWYAYGTDSMQVPLPQKYPGGVAFLPGAGGHACSLLPIPPACAGLSGNVLFSAHTMGSLAPASEAVPTYAGMGLDFNNHFAKSCAYGASAYKGISFWAKGTVPFHAAIGIPATTPSKDGGTCAPGGAKPCSDHYSFLAAPIPDGTTWKQFTITFSDSATFAQAGWGAPATFDAGHILNLQFQVNGETTATAAAPYDFAVDDIAFVP